MLDIKHSSRLLTIFGLFSISGPVAAENSKLGPDVINRYTYVAECKANVKGGYQKGFGITLFSGITISTKNTTDHVVKNEFLDVLDSNGVVVGHGGDSKELPPGDTTDIHTDLEIGGLRDEDIKGDVKVAYDTALSDFQHKYENVAFCGIGFGR